MEDVVVLLSYYENPSVVELMKHHLERFTRFNPGVAIVPVNRNELEQHPAWDYGNMWHQADNVYYRWFLSRNRVEGRRYVWFDYDTWCNQSVRDFFESVWDAAFACPDHFAYTDKPKWMWFNIPQLLPRGDQYRSKDQLYGVVPLCGVLMSQDVLARLVEEQVKDPATWRSVFCELRVGTLLKKCGVPIRKIGNATGLSACGRARAVQLASQGFKSIVHPVKTKLPG